MRIEKAEIRLAMLGMIEGNGHPYSVQRFSHSQLARQA